MSTRILLGSLAVLLLAVSFYTFVNYASSPTDENIFISLPGYLYVPQDHPNLTVEWMMPGGDPLRRTRAVEAVRAGDLVGQVNATKIRRLEEYREILGRTPPDSMVTLTVSRPAEAKFGLVKADRRDLPDDLLVQLEQGVAVTSVVKGGASDRAGMLPGDIIVRINGQGFDDAQEADRILRRAQSGREFTYEVVRGTERHTLTVVLARFGFPLSNLVLSLAGIIFMCAGTFIAVEKPNLKAARLLGLSFMLTGFAIAIASIRRDPDVTFFVAARGVAWIFSIFLGVATGWHASFLFPRERPEVLSRPWVIRTAYGMAIAMSILIILLGSLRRLEGNLGTLNVVGLAVVMFGLYFGAVRFAFRKQRTRQYIEQSRVIRITQIVVAVLSVAFAVIIVFVLRQPGQIGFIGLLVIFIPLGHLYTIGRYRLLDMNLRIRRNIQYTLVSALWTLIAAAALIYILRFLLTAPVTLPAVAVHGTSIEVGDAAGPAGEGKGHSERLAFMMLGAAAWYGVWKVRKSGQRLIDTRYFRSRYDYRRALNEMSSVLASKLGMTELGRGIVEKLAELMQLKRAAVYFFRDNEVCCCREAFGVEDRTWQEFCSLDDSELIPAIEQFSGVFSVDYLSERLKASFRDQEFRQIVPVRSKDRLIGALVLGEKRSESPFGQEDLEFLTAVAMQASVSIENAFLYEELAGQERLKQELEIARRIQLASLPQKVPAIGGLDIAGRSIPALEVGGDFFDYLNGTGDALTVVVGDVSGKGTSAALYMSKVQGILRSLHGFTSSPAPLLVHANRLLSGDMEKSSFVTVAGAAMDPASQTAVLARAGHLPVYLYRAMTGAVERLVPRGLGLGISDGTMFAAELEERTISYARGDVLLFVTDGITEARNSQGEEYGEERLQEVLCRSAMTSALEIRDRVLAAVKDFAGSMSQHDDQTVVVVRAV